MTSSLAISKILTITTDETIREKVEEIISSTEGFEIVSSQSLNEEIMEVVYSLQPAYILLDMDYDRVDPLKLIDSVSAQFPEIVIIAILSQDHLLDSQEVILAGARAILLEPFSSQDLVNTLHRIKELLGRRSVVKAPAEASQPLVSTRGTFVVISPKGGVGVSSVATNLALSLFEAEEEEVLLMDGKLLFGHLDVLLNLRTQNTVSDLIAHVAALDEGLIRDVVSQHVSGLHLLPAPLTITSGQGIRPDDMYRLISELQTVYKYIVIDGGNFLNDMAVTYMDAANKIILIVNPDIASLRDASQFFEVCRTLSYPKDKIQVVVNQYDKRDGLSLNDVEKSLQVDVLGTIPLDRKAAVQSINRGIPVTLQRARTPLRRAYADLAQNLLKVIGTGTTGRLGVAPRSEALSKSSRLG